jgi:hypothetical protein
LPSGSWSAEDLLNALFEFVKKARANLSNTLNTGLSDDDTVELLKTRDIATAMRLVRAGLSNSKNLRSLPV